MEQDKKQPFSNDEVCDRVRDAVRATIRKFRTHPDYFFTESDLHSYLYRRLYSSRMEYRPPVEDSTPIYFVHREYPTNFRYTRESLLLNDFVPAPIGAKEGDRGNYDLVVLNPDFVRTWSHSIEDIINKDNRRTVKRLLSVAEAVREPEILFAIEVKFVISNSQQFVAEVLQDTTKLHWAVRSRQARFALNLVFCSLPSWSSVAGRVASVVEVAPPDVSAVFVHRSRTMKKGERPRPLYNPNAAWSMAKRKS